MKTRALFPFNALVLALLLLNHSARAQEQDAPKFEIGVQYSSLSIDLPGFGGTRHAPGVGARVTYNLNNYFAVEAEGNIFPSTTQTDYTTGGDPQQMQFGVKVGKRWKRFGVFAKARPGFVSFSGVSFITATETFNFNGQQFVIPTVFDRTRRTYFSMDLGGVFEFYHSRRWLTRFDLGDTMIRYGDRQSFDTLPVGVSRTISGGLRHSLQFTAGLGLRF
jgi:hypothetical protein